MDLLILGAGVRAAAFSALRIGRNPACVDLFSDADLASACPSERIEAAYYPDGLVAFADRFEPTDWLYTGALENRPDLVDAISRRHRLLGNPGATLRAVRDPIALSEACRSAGLRTPEVRLNPAGLPDDGSWLRKPIASAGGSGIRPRTGSEREGRGASYFQRLVDGVPLASIHVGDGSTVRLSGITRQLIGRPGRPFAYRGSVGPWPVDPEVRERVDHMGRVIGASFGLVGIFGVDFILGGREPWPIEVNPRYTASVEVLEWALGRSILADHLRACGAEDAVIGPPVAHPLGFVGKQIMSAEQAALWTGQPVLHDPIRFPEIADVPRLGTTFRPGEPVLTVFSRGATADECMAGLDRAAERWRLG